MTTTGMELRNRLRLGPRLSLFGLNVLRRTIPAIYRAILWGGTPPHPGWHSFDRTPWLHPWLTPQNLSHMRDYSCLVYAWAHRIAANEDPLRFRFAFVGNMANGLYFRAVPLRRSGLEVDVIPHPLDRFIMSQPGWEDFTGELPQGASTLDDLTKLGIALPAIEGVREFALRPDWYLKHHQLPAFLLPGNQARFPSYMPFLPLLEALQGYDASLCTQAQYLAWLARKPYLVTQTGGDIWYEASRGDDLGWIQRAAFGASAAFLVSNPWSFAHARRFGLRNLVYVPMMLDETDYSPGEPNWRENWRSAVGGNFYVLMTSRLDRYYKGSDLALAGFAEFARTHGGARLVIVGWGNDRDWLLAALNERGIADRVLVLPITGKRRLIEYLRSADCLVDQFTLGYYGATALEAMACGLPVVMRIETAQYDALLPAGAPPILNAETANDIAARLRELACSEERRHYARTSVRRWFLAAHSGATWRQVYTDLLVATALGRHFDFSASPLHSRLTRIEREYHVAELAAAPRFPNYH